MRKTALFVLLLSILFNNGCESKSKESLEKQEYQIYKKMTALIKSIDDNNSARKAIPKLKALMKQLEENIIKRAKLSNNDIDIGSEYGIRTHSLQMNELWPAFGKLHEKNISKELMDEITNIIKTGTTGAYQKAYETMGQQNLIQTNEE